MQNKLEVYEKRWQYIIDNHLRAHSPHMDGTFGWSFRGRLNGLHKTPEEAVDKAIEEISVVHK